MKRLCHIFLSLLSCVSLAGCNTGMNGGSVSDSLDKHDVYLADMPQDYEFTDLVSYDNFSKYVAYNAINEALMNAKFYISFIGNGISISGMAIASVDAKTGERIGAYKGEIEGISQVQGMNGKMNTYIRGSRSYSDFNLSLYYADYNTSKRKTANISGKYYMDIPSSDEKGVGSFFGDNAAENPEFVNPYFFVETLKEDNGLIQDSGTSITKARMDGIDYYRITFASGFYGHLGISESEFTIAMNGKRIYGLAIKNVYTLQGSTSKMYSTVHMRPFTGKLTYVPETFDGYNMSYEQYMDYLSNEIMNLILS